MTEQPTAVGIPQWDLADRLKKGLRHADLGVAEMAEYLEVSRTSVSNWINGRVRPGKQTLRLWAMRTGVQLQWLETGQAPDDGPTPDELLPHLDSNQEPSGYRSPQVRRLRVAA